MIPLPNPVVQEILEYLADRPYREVFQMIAALQQAAREQAINELPKPEEPAEKADS